jgi:hypothetical protein
VPACASTTRRQIDRRLATPRKESRIGIGDRSANAQRQVDLELRERREDVEEALAHRLGTTSVSPSRSAARALLSPSRERFVPVRP